MDRIASRIIALFSGRIVGILGGLIGLGGAEFRIPILKDIFKLNISTVVKVNLLISFITLTSSLVSRLIYGKKIEVVSNINILILLIIGTILGAYIGSNLISLIKEEILEIIIGIILLFIGILLFSEAFFNFKYLALGLNIFSKSLMTIVIGIVIGMVSSMLGVAGGELIIPTLVLLFGINIKEAGSLSILISLPTVITSLIRYRKSQIYTKEMLKNLALPMGIGSIIGAIIGGILVSVVSTSFIKVFLSIIIFITSFRLIKNKKH